MRALSLCLRFLLLLAVCSALPSQAASAKVSKVLPQYLDKEGRNALSPSLFDRDAYQTHLRRHPEERYGMRFAIQWKGPKAVPLLLRLELRGGRGPEPTTAVIEQQVQRRGMFGNWSSLGLTGEAFKNFGELTAWRATLWDGARQLAEQRSFLW